VVERATVRVGIAGVLPRRSPFGRPVLRGLALAIAAALVVAGAALALVKRTPVTPPAPMVGLSVVLGPDLFLDTTPGGSKVALSPDGSRLAFVGRSGGRTRLFLRRLDRFENTVLPGTDNGLAPFFSPDGRWIGFVTLDGIKRMAVDGATPELVCPAPEAEGGAAWLTDDTVIFGGGQGVGLMRVSARGGTPRALTHVDTLRNEVMHSDPTVLPGGRTALFTVTVFDTTGVHARIEAVSLESAERRTVLDDGELVSYVEGVGIIFNRGMGVLAASFDPERLAVTGDPVPVVHDADDIAVTRNGMIAYIPGSATLPERSFAWVGMDGDEDPVDAPPRTYMNPRLSPDGRSVAVEIFDGRHFQIWTYDLVRAALTQLTPRPARMAFWTPDSKQVVVSSPQDGKFALLSYPIDKSNAGEVLTTQCGGGDASFSSDGQRLFCGGTPNGTLTSADILVLSDARHGAAKPFLQAPFIQGGPKVSPDDRWLAYMSDESGRWEVCDRASGSARQVADLDRRWDSTRLDQRWAIAVLPCRRKGHESRDRKATVPGACQASANGPLRRHVCAGPSRSGQLRRVDRRLASADDQRRAP
jgi:Tol biopolymer transport system component